MNIGFFSCGSFGVATLERCARNFSISWVVTHPPRIAGRGTNFRPTPIHSAAEKLGLKVVPVDNPKDTVVSDILRDNPVDLALVIDYGHLMPGKLLALPRLGMLNVHPSLLPKYRGATPVPRAILNGDAVTGVTLFRLNKRFDTGAIIAQRTLTLVPTDTSTVVLDKLAEIGADMLVDILPGYAAGTVIPQEQTDTDASQAPKFLRQDGYLTGQETAAEFDRKVRAQNPWPGAWITLYPQSRSGAAKPPVAVNVLQAAIEPGINSDAPAGTVLEASAKTGLILVASDSQPIRLQEIQPQNKKTVSAEAYLRGTEVIVGSPWAYQS